jgi:hypothetical protein
VTFASSPMQNYRMKAFYCTLLAIVIVSAILVALFATSKLSTGKNSDPVHWQAGPEGEVSPNEGNETILLSLIFLRVMRLWHVPMLSHWRKCIALILVPLGRRFGTAALTHVEIK